ncbi:hypothetical protein L3X38_031511 [Prunus dulcis]|uniref:Uncharacterized protein n=1 Tax=Prunus dulcis TaxID=3755 RepID=A0AAD4VC86_PRUDU|nr:hypothetical protein L3X38_031511 [Prunus dulcis]
MGDHPGKLLLWKLRRGLVGAHWLRVRRNSEVKRVGGWSNPRMGDHPGKLLRELPGTNPCGTLSSGPRADNIVLGVGSPQLGRGLLGAHWLRSCKNSEVKRVGGWSNPRMGDHPGKLLVSSQKQNRAGSEGGPKRTISCYGEAGPGCDKNHNKTIIN